MLKKLMAEWNRLRKIRRLEPIIDTTLFIIITFAIHYAYRYWEHQMDFSFFGFQVLPPALFYWFTDAVFSNSSWVVSHLIPIQTSGRTFFFENQTSINIVPSCSGIQQMLQFILLIIIYPGPWKHKSWFIVLGSIIIHLTNVFRISGLCIVMAHWPKYWHWSHDYPFRIIFYVVIFFLWVIWNDNFYHGKSKAKMKAE
ncbi:MAG: archaeosortase/exosortase family protein [Bacteroidetes bacterium]|nr:archaeosortase/exosortase family protein [Bacteroidota bacterium]